METSGTKRTGTGAHALLVCPNQGMFSELAPLLSHHLPGVQLAQLKQYPESTAIATMTASGVRLVFVDAETDERRGQELIRQLQGAAAGIQVVALFSNNSPDRILQCLRHGASEFLIRPFTPEELKPVLERVAKISPALAGGQRAKVVLIAPVKGSCGASTLAANLAFQRKGLKSEKLLLVDLDPLTGTLGFQLKLKSNFSFADALSRASGLDEDLWRAMVARYGEIDVLLAPENPADIVHELRDPVPVLEFARRLYDTIVVDCAGVFSEWCPMLAAISDDVLLVTTGELPQLLATQRALAYLENHGIGRDRLRLIVNRYSRDGGLGKDAIAAALQSEIYQIIPADYDAVRTALVEGKTANPASAFGKAVASLASKVSGNSSAGAKRAKAPFLGGILGSIFSRAAS